jgi:hypothetical protein
MWLAGHVVRGDPGATDALRDELLKAHIAGVRDLVIVNAKDHRNRVVSEEQLTDAERRRLLALAIEAVPADKGDPMLTGLIAKLSGTDTVVIVRRAYPSRS